MTKRRTLRVGRSRAATRAAEHEISPANVGRLTTRWTLNTVGAISATATVDEGLGGITPVLNNNKV